MGILKGVLKGILLGVLKRVFVWGFCNGDFKW